MSNTAGAGSNTAGSTGSTRTPPSFDAASILPVDQITAFTIADVTHDDRPEIIVLDGSPDASRQLAVVQANADRVLSTISGTNNVASYAVSLAVARLTPLYDPYQFIMTNPHYLDVGSINWDSSTGFGSAASWTNDIASTYILAVDINNDGKQDVIEVGPGTLVVMLGDGVGGFREPSYQFGDTHAGSFARTADFNEDGNVDVAQSGPAVVLGNGDGTFGPWNYLTSVSPDRQDVEVADFNNDGHTDVVAPTTNEATVSLFWGYGDGGFSSGITSDVGFKADSIAAGDIDGDGKPDLVLGSYSNFPARLAILLGRGDGTFEPHLLDLPAGDGPIVDLKVVDLDGDGRLDIVVAERSPALLRIMFQN